MIRFALQLPPRTHLNSSHFENVGWLPIELRVEQIRLNHMHKVYNKTAPQYLIENFRLVKEHHFYITRSSVSNFILPGVNSAGRNSSYYTGAKSWNSLPNDIKNIEPNLSFKQHLKQHLFAQLRNVENSDFIFY